MATREDQAQPIILDAFIVPWRRFVGNVLDALRMVLDRIEPSAPPDAVDRFEPAGRNEPRPRILGNAVPRPLLERCAKCVMQRFFGDIEIAEQPHQRGEDTPRFRSVDGLCGMAYAID